MLRRFEAMRVRPFLWRLALGLVLTAIVLGSVGWLVSIPGFDSVRTAVEIYHLPERYARRDGDLSANITGFLSPWARDARFQLNEGSWQEIPQAPPRAPAPFFTIELPVNELRPGANKIELEARNLFGSRQSITRAFAYSPAPVSIPVTVDWSQSDLDVQDGYWEIITSGDERRVRPKPGFEDYDRILMVTGAFPGGRRVETDITFRGMTGKGPWGFGVLPLWSGHPDNGNVRPRRGWHYSIAWYYVWYHGVGNSFALKNGDLPERWVASYRNFEVAAGGRYSIKVETWSVVDSQGNHVRFHQRLKWWVYGEPEPDEWLELTDSDGTLFPQQGYAVALIAHRSQVEFGPITVSPLDPLPVTAAMQP